VHENFKRFICEAAETDTILLNRNRTPALRALRTDHAEAIDLEDRNAMSELGNVLDLYFGGDMQASIALSGQVAGRIEAVTPVKEILHAIFTEFVAVGEALGRTAAASRAA
jgi:enoyl-[acyl-carrier protein] reductase II